MAKVYVVHKGQYSDRRIRAVFTDKAKAEEFQEYADSDNCVEEWDLDSAGNVPDWYKQGLRVYKCWLRADVRPRPYEIDVFLCDQDDVERRRNLATVEPRDLPYGDYYAQTCCLARDKAHAIKIAADRFAQWKAQQSGIA